MEANKTTEGEQQAQVRDSASSSSAINESHVSSSSRNVETGQIRNADGYDAETPMGVAEEDDHNDGDDEHETESLLPHLDAVFISTPTSYQLTNPIGTQQQLNHNAAPPSPQNIYQQLPVDPFDQQSPLPHYAAPWIPQTTSEQLPVANQIPSLAPLPNQMIVPIPECIVPNHEPWNPQNTSQQISPYQMANLQNPYPPPMTYQSNPPPIAYQYNPPLMVYQYNPPPMAYQQNRPLMANLQNPYPPAMAYLQNPYPPSMAYQHNPTPMANLQNPYEPPMAYLQNRYEPTKAYLQNPYPPPMANLMMPRFRSDQMLRMRPPRGHPRSLAGVRNTYSPQQLQQLQPHLQQSAQSQGFDDGASSDHDHDQDQQQPT